MRLRLSARISGLVISAAVASGSAIAGPALDDDKKAAPPSAVTDPVAEPPLITGDTNLVEYGVTLRLRNVRAPKFIIEMFTERAVGASNFGIGADFVRRRGTTELMLGFEYEHIQPGEGVFIEAGTDVAAGDEADYIVNPDHNNGKQLGWLSFEFTFFNHVPIRPEIAFRYGFGAGLGIVTGDLGHYNVICVGATNSNPEPGCKPMGSPFNGNGLPSPDKGGMVVQYNLPPVFPVLNAIVGFQFKPMPKATINVEAGIRTFPFFGVSGGYFF
jgi:hypothetical protein